MSAVEPCPYCDGIMGDGDRVSHGICALCVMRSRRRRRR